MTLPIAKSIKAKDVRRWDIVYVLEEYRGIQRVSRCENGIELELSNEQILVLDPKSKLLKLFFL